MAIKDYDIKVRDLNDNFVGMIDQFDVLDIRLRFNAVGSWMVQSTRADSALLGFGGGVSIQRNDATITSGPLTVVKRKWNRRGGNIQKSFGNDDNIWLRRRWASPEPSGPPYTNDSHDEEADVAETVMKEYVDVNVGPNANVDRQELTIEADAATGDSISMRARFDLLLDLLQSSAIKGGGLGFQVVDKEFQVFTPTDRTGTIVFSEEYQNLEEYEYTVKAPQANYVLAAGQNEGVNRDFQESGDSASIITYGRIERFIDQRQLATDAELLASVNEELDAAGDEFSYTFLPISIMGMELKDDYWLGDKITVVIDGVTIQDIIREIRIKVDRKNGERITPIVATDKLRPGFFSQLARQNKQVEARILNLERR